MEEPKQISKFQHIHGRNKFTDRILRKTDQPLMFHKNALPLSPTFKLLVSCKHHDIDTEREIKKSVPQK
jgi:hypothetical protein